MPMIPASTPDSGRILVIEDEPRLRIILKKRLEVFADDYLTKPWETRELLFRVRNQLKTRRAQLQSNALTGLPGNVLIETELTRRIAAGEKFAFLHLDLDFFKAYNDYYGYARG